MTRVSAEAKWAGKFLGDVRLGSRRGFELGLTVVAPAWRPAECTAAEKILSASSAPSRHRPTRDGTCGHGDGNESEVRDGQRERRGGGVAEACVGACVRLGEAGLSGRRHSRFASAKAWRCVKSASVARRGLACTLAGPPWTGHG